jgi:hypothetical protein
MDLGCGVDKEELSYKSKEQFKIGIVCFVFQITGATIEDIGRV